MRFLIYFFVGLGQVCAGTQFGWGIDACLTCHVDDGERPAYLKLLNNASLGWLRERQPTHRMKMLHEAGYRINAFISLEELKVQHKGNQLPEDLLEVFRASKAMQEKQGEFVNAWEMVGEPDIGYCRDLPERVVAFQKAVYLGIKRGARQSMISGERRSDGKPEADEPLVLMGALASPPGRWLERAASNDLLEYTDAYNFHFYGHAQDFTGEIDAHRAFVNKWRRRDAPIKSWWNGLTARFVTSRSPLPFWITECGMNAVDADDLLNESRREVQADFALSTANQALLHPDVAMFMPFVLAWEGRPWAMTLSAEKPLPAWNAYAKFTRENLWPERSLAKVPVDPDPVVVQWMPDNDTTVPHKVSGTYRFKGDASIKGEIRLYNFSELPVSGSLIGGKLKHVKVEAELSKSMTQPPSLTLNEIVIPAMGMVVVPITLSPETKGYFSEFWSVDFVSENGRKSPLYFGIERAPSEADFVAFPLKVAPPAAGQIKHPMFVDYRHTSHSGAWVGINGLVVGKEESLRMKNEELGMAKGKLGNKHPTRLMAWTSAVENDPLAPSMAIARVSGLPTKGFLHLSLDRPMSTNGRVRVDLLDKEGRRFTIWENLGVSYATPKATEAWLNLADFHNYSWGRSTRDHKFHPDWVEEIQLRFYFAKANTRLTLGLELRQARNGFQKQAPLPLVRGWANMRN